MRMEGKTNQQMAGIREQNQRSNRKLTLFPGCKLKMFLLGCSLETFRWLWWSKDEAREDEPG
jgi:hypothetical protein